MIYEYDTEMKDYLYMFVGFASISLVIYMLTRSELAFQVFSVALSIGIGISLAMHRFWGIFK